VPAIPSCILEPLWEQFATLLPTRQVHHPLGCHRQRIPERIIFDKLIQVLVWLWLPAHRRSWLALASAVIVLGRLLRRARTHYRWEGRPGRRP
jgi:hypothetical protein